MPSARAISFTSFATLVNSRKNCSNTEGYGSELAESVASNEAKIHLLAGFIGEECVPIRSSDVIHSPSINEFQILSKVHASLFT